MSPILVLSVIVLYFCFLLLISYLTSKNTNSDTFFTGNRQSPWYVVAFGMIGASLSGVTFVSVPGYVGASQFSYFQMVIGYLLGYYVIATVLMPLYYRMNLVSIYGYLKDRFGLSSYKTGSFFFLLSQTIGAAFRLFLVAGVLQLAFFEAYNIPFEITVAVTILLIWMYTFKGGIKTIVWTDTLQTLFMLSAVCISIYIIAQDLDLSFNGVIQTINEHDFSKTFFWDWKDPKNFFKQFFSGAFIAIVMTGLDQNMMQKNLTVKTLKDSQKNMFWFSSSLIFVNLLFLGLGALLFIYAGENQIPLPKRADDLYPLLALNHFSLFAGIVFLLGITSAAYSSADSSLTALTTAFCIDFLNHEDKDEAKVKKERKLVHIGFSFVLFAVIVIFRLINDESVISSVFKAAGYTYGPLLGLFAFGLITKAKVHDRYVPIICFVSPIISYVINTYSEDFLFGYKFGYEILMLNGAITFIGLLVLTRSNHNLQTVNNK